MKISTKYNIGDIVYIKHDPEQKGYDITGISIRPGNIVLYELNHIDQDLDIYEFQVSDQVDQEKLLGLNKKEED